VLVDAITGLEVDAIAGLKAAAVALLFSLTWLYFLGKIKDYEVCVGPYVAVRVKSHWYTA
jgi:hypothetical protein